MISHEGIQSDQEGQVNIQLNDIRSADDQLFERFYLVYKRINNIYLVAWILTLVCAIVGFGLLFYYYLYNAKTLALVQHTLKFNETIINETKCMALQCASLYIKNYTCYLSIYDMSNVLKSHDRKQLYSPYYFIKDDIPTCIADDHYDTLNIYYASKYTLIVGLIFVGVIIIAACFAYPLSWIIVETFK